MNILYAVKNIAELVQTDIQEDFSGRNRINNIGKALEKFIQNAFAGTFNVENEGTKLSKFEDIFSYQGNQNNPPDLMLIGSDAIEVKKIEGKNSSIALNSSYPKARLYRDDDKITNTCKNCEDWTVKDIIYAVGNIENNKLRSLWMVYGDCYAADREIYERIKHAISSGVNAIEGISFTDTKELGKVKCVDPLGITDLRVRGMWHIFHPNSVFSYISPVIDLKESEFKLMVLMKRSKFDSFPDSDKQQLNGLQGVCVHDIKIKNPNNPVQLMNCKLITYTR